MHFSYAVLLCIILDETKHLFDEKKYKAGCLFVLHPVMECSCTESEVAGLVANLKCRSV